MLTNYWKNSFRVWPSRTSREKLGNRHQECSSQKAVFHQDIRSFGLQWKKYSDKWLPPTPQGIKTTKQMPSAWWHWKSELVNNLKKTPQSWLSLKITLTLACFISSSDISIRFFLNAATLFRLKLISSTKQSLPRKTEQSSSLSSKYHSYK